MEQRFLIVTASADIKNSRVVMEASKYVDITTVCYPNVEIIEEKSKSFVHYKATNDGRTIYLNFEQSPVPNSNYIITVKNIVSVAGEKLTSSFSERLSFISSIKTKVEITSPNNFAKIDDLKIILEEKAPEGIDSINRYRIQISEHVGFYSNVRNTIIEDSTIDIAGLDKGKQYYMRARVETEDEYSAWSETTTFFISDGEEGKTEDDTPIFEDYTKDLETGFEIIEFPDDCDDSNSLCFEFNKEIDENEEYEIIVVRRDLK